MSVLATNAVGSSRASNWSAAALTCDVPRLRGDLTLAAQGSSGVLATWAAALECSSCPMTNYTLVRLQLLAGLAAK